MKDWLTLKDVAGIAGVSFMAMKQWRARNRILYLHNEDAPNGKKIKLHPETVGCIIAFAKLIEIGYTAEAANKLIYGPYAKFLRRNRTHNCIGPDDA